MFKTYAGACKMPLVAEKNKEMFIADGWKLIDII